MIDYRDVLFTFVIALAVSFFLTPVMRKIALRKGIVNRPGGRKVHKKPIPYLGGVAIYLAFISALFFASCLEKLLRSEYLTGLFLGGTFIVVIGLFDDIKGVRPSFKFLGQILAASILFKYGFRIEFITNPFLGGTIHFPLALSFLITLLWIVALTNAINLIDGLDGLAAGLVIIASSVLFLVTLGRPDPITTFLCVIIMGSSLGFLRYNFYPARIFMGDAGSMLLGFALAAMGTIGIGKGVTAVTLMVPIVALGIPIYDTSLAIFRRLMGKKSIFIADKKHLHHRLLDMGLSHRQVVLLLYFVSIYLGIMGYLFVLTSPKYAFILLILLGMGVFAGMRTLGFIERRIRKG
jgi:UDP-GlcNAc:undecaprenyl-phosphate GlcNAc-1-phosphate transferase